MSHPPTFDTVRTALSGLARERFIANQRALTSLTKVGETLGLDIADAADRTVLVELVSGAALGLGWVVPEKRGFHFGSPSEEPEGCVAFTLPLGFEDRIGPVTDDILAFDMTDEGDWDAPRFWQREGIDALIGLSGEGAVTLYTRPLAWLRAWILAARDCVAKGGQCPALGDHAGLVLDRTRLAIAPYDLDAEGVTEIRIEDDREAAAWFAKRSKYLDSRRPKPPRVLVSNSLKVAAE